MLKHIAHALLATALTMPTMTQAKWSNDYLREQVEQIATIERHRLMPMRDGVGLSTDIYRPKDAAGPLPTIFIRTPYNMEKPWESEMRLTAEALKRGYAVVFQNERGRYFSEGKFQILGYPQTDGYDALSWIAKQPWSNGKVGTLGCSSSAEWQLALATMNHPAHAAMVPMASGAGIGQVGRFWEQGNWFMGGAQRSLYTVWLYDTDNPLRAQLPSGLDPKARSRIAQYNDLDPAKPVVDWPKQIRHLPVADILADLGEPSGTFEQLIKLEPASKEWRKGGLYQENKSWGVPALWFNSWYDVSIGPNMELFNHVRATSTDAEARDNQYVIVGPNAHCEFEELSEETVVGERPMGDARLDVRGEILRWFDHWLKGDTAAFDASTPPVRYYAMGRNKWQSSTQWPPAAATPLRLYLSSGGRANSLYGDGTLMEGEPVSAGSGDTYVYDPLNPVDTLGGGDCCNGGLITAGAADQRKIEARQDVLVYSSPPLPTEIEVTGFVNSVLSVSSSAKDTDFAIKLVDVAPDGTAYIIGDTILRARYRDGYELPTFMKPAGIYTIRPTPITTSIVFQKGHRIRVEVTSSNFPKFYRNLNTGGDNVTETAAVVATNTVHHSREHPSYIELPVVR